MFFSIIDSAQLPQLGKENTYYHIHFHVHEKELSQILSKKLQALVARGELFINFIEDKKNLKRIGLELLGAMIFIVSSYKLIQAYLKHKKVYEELKIIIFDNDEIDDFLKSQSIPDTKNSSSFLLFYCKEIEFTKYWFKKTRETKQEQALLKRVFEIIKKDYRFSQILFLLQKESLSKSILYKMIHHLIYSEYIAA